MENTINGRTPEEIKDGMQRCMKGRRCISGSKRCSYYPECLSGYSGGKMFRNAFAYIERLESERDAALAKVPKWISVEERLPPPETERYLVVCVYPTKDTVVKTAIWAWDENDEQGDWIIWGVVTHWMPLPEPPEVSE